MTEYETIKNHQGLFDFSLEGKISVKGDGSVEFLNGLVSNDLVHLKEEQGISAAFLNKFGQIIADCFIYRRKTGFLIFLPIAQKQKIFEKLRKESTLVNCVVEDLSMQYGLFSLQGKEAKTYLEKFFQIKLDENREILRKKIAFLVFRRKRSSVESFDIMFPALHYQEFLKELALKKNSAEVYEILRLEAGIPLMGIDFDEKTMLLEIGEEAVSFTKGCYVGQEVIARVKNLAKGITAKKLVRLEIEGKENFVKSTEINSANQKIGFITSATYSPGLQKVVALGFITKGFYDKKTVEVCGKKGLII